MTAEIAPQISNNLFGQSAQSAKKFDMPAATSSNTSRLESHSGIFRLLMKEIFDSYVL